MQWNTIGNVQQITGQRLQQKGQQGKEIQLGLKKELRIKKGIYNFIYVSQKDHKLHKTFENVPVFEQHPGTVMQRKQIHWGISSRQLCVKHSAGQWERHKSA